MKCKSPAAAILLIIIPLTTLLGHSTYLYLKFLH
jgi:hypothetical protein